MTVIDTLTQRNEAFADSRFSADLKIMPSMKTMIIGCVDPRVDPADIFGLVPGEAAVIRNVGGRITPATLQIMAMLRIVAQANGGEIGQGWNFIVLHHTDCGITCLAHSPELLAKHFGVAPGQVQADRFGHTESPHSKIEPGSRSRCSRPPNRKKQLSGEVLAMAVGSSAALDRRTRRRTIEPGSGDTSEFPSDQ
jgi:carbonic anhydrase